MSATISSIKEVDVEKEHQLIFPLIQQLYAHLNENSFSSLLIEMKKQGYQLIGLYREEKVVAVAGFRFSTNFYDGNHIYLYDFVTEKTERSKGYGKILLTYLQDLAKTKNCKSIVLSSRFDRTEAHRFYLEKMDYEKTSYVIKKNLEK